jgi:hypothetical protein
VYRSGAIKISSLQGDATQMVNGQKLKHYISGDLLLLYIKSTLRVNQKLEN